MEKSAVWGVEAADVWINAFRAKGWNLYLTTLYQSGLEPIDAVVPRGPASTIRKYDEENPVVYGILPVISDERSISTMRMKMAELDAKQVLIPRFEIIEAYTPEIKKITRRASHVMFEEKYAQFGAPHDEYWRWPLWGLEKAIKICLDNMGEKCPN